MADFDRQPKDFDDALRLIAEFRGLESQLDCELQQLTEDNTRALDELEETKQELEKLKEIKETMGNVSELWYAYTQGDT